MEHNSLADIGATCEIQKKKIIMCPKRTVNVDQSVRLLKFYWWLLEAGPEGVTFEYLRKAQNDMTVKGNLYNIQQIID